MYLMYVRIGRRLETESDIHGLHKDERRGKYVRKSSNEIINLIILNHFS